MKKKIIFIIGCQRSGTTALSRALALHDEFHVFNESKETIHQPDRLSKNNNPIRLKSLSEVEKIFKETDKPFIFSKPLVESQNIDKLLDYFPNSLAIWCIRNPTNVSNSIINKWGNKFGPQFLKNVSKGIDNWQTENIPTDLKSLIELYCRIPNKPINGALLFWIWRNYAIYKKYEKYNSRIYKCVYEDLLKTPGYYENLIKDITGISAKSFVFKSQNPVQNELTHHSHPFLDKISEYFYQKLYNLN